MSENIEKIIYINLKKRTCRKEQIENELKNYNLEYERFEGIEIPEQGTLGCGYSHLAVLKLAKERGYKNILILEDDFVFTVSKEKFENSLQNFFNLKINYDVCMLIYNNRAPNIDINIQFISKIVNSTNACAYLVNHTYYDKLIDLLEENLVKLKETKMHWLYANDACWASLQQTDNWFGFLPQLGVQQSLGFSDT